jgi:fermentation-respiration switch protein FrsA (DUF1100 family)
MPGFFFVVTMFGCDRVFYYPDARVRGNPSEYQLKYEDVYFTSQDGVRLHGWYFPASGRAKGTVLHVHGNAGNITSHYEFIRWLPVAGYNVLTFDYRGYGQSGGQVTRSGTMSDANAALDYLRSRSDIDKSKIVVFGQSIGGTVATALTARRREQVAALAIDSCFTSHKEIARYHVTHHPLLFCLGWWFPMTIADGQDAVDEIGKVAPTPLLIMQGKRDRIVPWKMGQRLFDAAKDPKELWLIDDSDHMEVWFTHSQEAQDRLSGFFDRALGSLRSRNL